jgi:hypothetical protein
MDAIKAEDLDEENPGFDLPDPKMTSSGKAEIGLVLFDLGKDKLDGLKIDCLVLRLRPRKARGGCRLNAGRRSAQRKEQNQRRQDGR